MQATEAIEAEKSSTGKDPKILVLLQQSMELQRIVSVWPSVPKDIEKLFENVEAPVDRRQRWEWLWGRIEVDRAEWLRLALLANNPFNRDLIERAITLRMVFPDGSLHGWVDRYVSFMAVGVFAGKGKKGKKDDIPHVAEG